MSAEFDRSDFLIAYCALVVAVCLYYYKGAHLRAFMRERSLEQNLKSLAGSFVIGCVGLFVGIENVLDGTIVQVLGGLLFVTFGVLGFVVAFAILLNFLLKPRG